MEWETNIWKKAFTGKIFIKAFFYKLIKFFIYLSIYLFKPCWNKCCSDMVA